jgi:hypothetical protein
MVQLDVANHTAVSVRMVALSKCECIRLRMGPNINTPVVQERTKGAATALILVNHQDQAVELACRVQTRGCLARLRLPDVPELEVAGAPVHARCSEVQLRRPVAGVV